MLHCVRGPPKGGPLHRIRISLEPSHHRSQAHCTAPRRCHKTFCRGCWKVHRWWESHVLPWRRHVPFLFKPYYCTEKIEKIMSIIDYHYCCYQYLLFCCVYIHVFSVSWDDCPLLRFSLAPSCDYKNSAFQERNMLWSDPATHTESPKKSEVPSGNLLQSY